jgi:hypothetical protein
MDSQLPHKMVFLSYVEEDGELAHALAEGLEAHNYSTWYYERDCPAGADYFEETYKAISDCDAMLVLISPRSLPSDQITREIVRAVEGSKATLPLLLELTHDEYAKRRPGWKQAMAASNATRISAEKIPAIIPNLIAGLNAKGIRAENDPHPPTSADLTKTGSGTWAAPSTGNLTPPPTPPAAGPEASVTPAPFVAPGPLAAPPLAPVRTPAARAPSPKNSSTPPIGIFIGAAALLALGFGVYHFTRPKAPPPKPIQPITATVVLQSAPDRHNCTTDVNVVIGGKSVHPTTGSFAVSGVTAGPQDYSVAGLVSCPGRKASKVAGSGPIDIKEGAVFAIAWQGKPGAATGIEIHDASAPPAGESDEPKQSMNSSRAADNTPKPTRAPQVAQQNDVGQQMFLNSQAALKQGHVFEPPVGSALYWAIQSRNAGNQGGKEMEAQLAKVYSAQVTAFYQQRNYPAALQLVKEMEIYYPNSPGLQQDQAKIIAAMNGAVPVNGMNPGQIFQQQLQQIQRIPPPGPPPRE